jgi:NAD(P)H-hydrate epimerase
MSLPEWLEPLYDAEQMRAIDRWAIEQRGVPSLDLMERAGGALARVAEGASADGPIAVVCGKGNNGGDGLVAARLLRQAGRDATVVAAGDLREMSGDAAANLARLSGPAPVGLGEVDLGDFELAVDALLGTGFEGEPRGVVAEAIAALNAVAVPVVSADVPSGVDASTGVVKGVAVRAARTVTFHAAKPGLWVSPGKQHAGEVDVIDIGIPRGAPVGADAGLIGPSVADALPRRGADSTKFASGHVLVVGGSRGLTGAPSLACESAMRAGAGYVTACVPASLQTVFEVRLLEVMTRGLADADGALLPDGVYAVLEAAQRGGSLALGPGIGRSDGAFALARELARRAPVALVLDADGLNAHAGRLESLRERTAPTVLTPHAGELARLLETDSEAVGRERWRHAREAADRAQAVVVLKGDDTLVAEPGGRVAVSPGASPALATAGTGDVLTGVVAALLASGLDAFTAAGAAVWLHAWAGREAARRQGAPEGVIASDVIASLPAARGGG